MDTLRNGRLQGGNQNNKRALIGFCQTLPLDIQSSSKVVVDYAKQYESDDNDIGEITEGD